MKVLLDTSIIARFCQTGDPKYTLVTDAVGKLSEQGYDLCLVPQVVYEFWSVATRPLDVNGLGWSTDQAAHEIEKLEELFSVLKDERSVYGYWLKLVTSFKVGGRNSHDARLVAAMDRHAISSVLTLDAKDFNRFDHIVILRPAEVVASK